MKQKKLFVINKKVMMGIQFILKKSAGMILVNNFSSALAEVVAQWSVGVTSDAKVSRFDSAKSKILLL